MRVLALSFSAFVIITVNSFRRVCVNFSPSVSVFFRCWVLVFSYLISWIKMLIFVDFSFRFPFSHSFIVIIESKRIPFVRSFVRGDGVLCVSVFFFVIMLFKRILLSKSWFLITERVPTVSKPNQREKINNNTKTNKHEWREWIVNTGWKYLQNVKRAKYICCEDQQKAPKIRLWKHTRYATNAHNRSLTHSLWAKWFPKNTPKNQPKKNTRKPKNKKNKTFTHRTTETRNESIRVRTSTWCLLLCVRFITWKNWKPRNHRFLFRF